MKRREFCLTAVAAGVAATIPGCSRAPSGSNTAGTIDAITGAGEEVSIEQAAVTELAESLNGTLYLPDNDGYDAVRKIWNGMHDKHPSMIVQCSGADDVVDAVNFARDHNMLVAIRGGGHSLPGKSTCDGGMMIDLSQMHGADVDVEARTARIDGGALLGHLDNAAMAHGMLTTTGIVSHTGVGGFTLGGGVGRVDRKFGLAIDNLLGATIVTAAGDVVQASESENPDLFWAIRGGGGNFGVATEFLFQLHPFNPTVYGGTVTAPLSKELLSFYAEFAEEAPDAANIEPNFVVAEDGTRIMEIEVVWAGDHAEGEKAFAPLLAFDGIQGALGPTSYHEIQTGADTFLGHGRQYYLKSGFITELTPEAIEIIVENLNADQPPGAWMQHMGGRTSRVAPDATAFSHRNAMVNFGIMMITDDPAETEAGIANVRQFYNDLAPHMTGFYTNLNDDTERKTWGNYGENYPRLVEIKNQYDPTNLFRLNANIKPTV